MGPCFESQDRFGRPRLKALLLLVLMLGGIWAGDRVSAQSGDQPDPASINRTHSILDPDYFLGNWMWAESRKNRQTCRFWKVFEIPRSTSVKNAILRVTADDNYELFLDGRRVGRGSVSSNLSEYDLSDLLPRGKHVIGIESFNDSASAGVIVGMQVELANGQTLEIASDATWRIPPKTVLDWEKRLTPMDKWPYSKVVGTLKNSPWADQQFALVRVGRIPPIVIPIWQETWFQVGLAVLSGTALVVILYLLSQLASQAKAQRFLQLERARIGRDIHDDVGARLTQLVLQGERAQRDAASTDLRVREHFSQMCERTREVLRAMDEVVWTVNSRHDTVQDFEAYVCAYAEKFLENTPIRCRLDVPTDTSDATFDLAIRRTLFLAIKEALNNAVKYSGATELFLRIHPGAHEMVAVVEDNGKGFAVSEANPQRHGLTNMVQRVREVGGGCQIVSAPGKGCRIEFRTPLAHSPRGLTGWWRGHWRQRADAHARQDRAQVIAAHTIGEVSKS